MCTVQVLLFAEVMRRSTHNSNSGLRPTGAVCRKLFSSEPSTTDPSQLLQTMEMQLRTRDMERWNFDFQKDKPLPGRYQWVAVGGPQRDSVIEQPQRPSQEVEIVAEVHPRPASSSIPAKGKTRRRSSAGAATQAKITDFLSKRKRPHPEEGVTSSHKLKLRRLSNSSSSFNMAATTRPT